MAAGVQVPITFRGLFEECKINQVYKHHSGLSAEKNGNKRSIIQLSCSPVFVKLKKTFYVTRQEITENPNFYLNPDISQTTDHLSPPHDIHASIFAEVDRELPVIYRSPFNKAL